MKSLGFSGISKEEMLVTPSLRNLNEDPTMTDSLVYYLQQARALDPAATPPPARSHLGAI